MKQKVTLPRAVMIVLDQNAASIRQDEDTVLGFDLFGACVKQCEALRNAGKDVMFALPLKNGTDYKPTFHASDVPVVLMDTDFEFGSKGTVLGDKDMTLVAADRKLRGKAEANGMSALPHPALLEFAMAHSELQAARLAGPKDVILRWSQTARSVPMHFQPAPEGGWAWIGHLDQKGLVQAAMTGLQATTLDYDIATDDLLWARLDHVDDEMAKVLEGRKILYSEPGQVLIALGPDESPDALDLHGEHGHAELLSQMPDLMAPVAKDASASIDPDLIDLRLIEPVRKVDLKDILQYLLPTCGAITADFESDLDRYTGLASLDAAGPIVSRHIAHPDNKRAEAQLLKDLRAMGYCPYRHNFSHAGVTHSSIIADLPGRGRFEVAAEVLEPWRRLILGEPLRELPKSAQRALRSSKLSDLSQLSDPRILTHLEELMVLRPWYPWWCLRDTVQGIGAQVLIVGCHMDSTAGLDGGYNPATDPAPGRDDDGSGLAGVLSIARHMASMRGKLTNTVRFCFFNAEEAGLVGSKAYAAMLKAQNAPVMGAICMDMIGYNSDAHRLWEVHAGYTDPAIRDASLPLAQAVTSGAQDYGALPAGQIYSGTSATSGAPDRSLFDGAINRSDHAAFHQQGWPAVVVSEDFFANLGSEPASDANVNYHRAADTTIDIAYARDIVCAVARAVTQLAA